MSNVVISCLTPGAAFDRAAEGLLGEAERVARTVGAEHVVVAPAGDDSLLQSCAAHADTVVAIEDGAFAEYHPESCLAVLHAACNQFDPHAVFLGQDTYSQEVAPRLAHRLGGSSIGDAQSIEIIKDGKIQVLRSVYGGKANAIVQANASPAVVWLRARAFAPQENRSTPGSVDKRTVLTADQPDTIDRTKVIDRQREASTGVRLEDAQIIVSGGRGLGGPEPFEELKKLAASMDAQMGASRAACDSGWVPPGWQVGQTGKKVAPELYLAIAISGASQHLMGISDAKVVAAINTDAEAPIFRRCDFGVVDDWKNIVGPLTDELSKSQA